MSILPILSSRISSLQFGNLTTQTISTTQQQLLDIQTQLSTGKSVNVPSDDPSAAGVIQQLQVTLDNQKGYNTNVTNAQSQLATVDSTIGDLTDLLQQAQSVASANVSSTVTAEQRAAAATVVDSLYSQALGLANKTFEGSYVFGGDLQNNPPYVESAIGVQFVGSTTTLKTTIDQSTSITYQVSGDSVFGGISSQVTGAANLAPAINLTSRVSQMRGATGGGVQLGTIQVGNGSGTVLVDLSHVDNAGDIVNAINNSGLTNVTASLSTSGIILTPTAGANVSVSEVGGGSTASDLGILQTSGAGVNTPLNGSPVNSKVTPFVLMTSLASGAGIDPTGFTIKNGAKSATIAITAGMNVEGLLNEINGAGLGVRAVINPLGNGINLQNTLQGTEMTVSENGGTTASDLGLRSLTPSTPLADLNDGKGVRTATGQPDFNITTANGTVISVGIAGAATVQDVIDKINTAAGASLTASFASTGNGIVLTDNTTGGATLTLQPINASSAAVDLGLTTPATGNTIAGADTNGVSTAGVFTHLQQLSAALRASDTKGITSAAENLATDSKQATQVRGMTGGLEQELTAQQSRLSDAGVATKSLMSQLQDVDYTSAITTFQTLQNSLQAALQTSAKTLNMSLLDYLR